MVHRKISGKKERLHAVAVWLQRGLQGALFLGFAGGIAGIEGLNCIGTQCSGELRGGELVHPSHGIPRLGDGGRGLRSPWQSGWRVIV